MRIAIVSTMNLPVPAVRGGAVEMLTTHIIDENEKNKNLDIDLFTIYDPNIDVDKYKYTNIIQIKSYMYETLFRKIVNFKNKIFKTGKKYNVLYKKLAKKVSKRHYDKIIIENNMEVYVEIQKLTNDCLIYHMHNDFNSSDKTIKNYKIVARTAEKILAVGYYIKSRLEAVYDNKNIEVFLNAIDDELYNEENANSWRNKYNINDNDIVIGYSGRITEEKGILELIKAIKKIKTDKSIKLLIVGSQWYGKLKNDKYMNQLNDEIETIKNNVIFTGYINQEDMPNIYKTIDILVVPSLMEEAFGCVAIEGMAMGKPIIVAESGELPKIVKEDFGFVISKNDSFVENLAISMEMLINDDNLRIKYGVQAKKEFQSNLNYHKAQYYINFCKYLKNDEE